MSSFVQYGADSIGQNAVPGARPGRPVCRIGLVLASLLLAPAAPAGAAEPEHTLGSGVQLRCQQPSETRLQCDYRLLRPAVVEGISARLKGLALPAPGWAAYEQSENSGAILLMADVSDPERLTAIEKYAPHIDALLDAAGPNHRFGLATFDSELELKAAIGSDRDRIRAEASRLTAAGRTTELYRTALEAIRVLAAAPGYPRALVIMSDGLAEDRAYFHHDVVAAARVAGVTIFAIGYPRSVPLSVGLQSLRRLTEETGGLYTDTGQAFTLEPEFIGDALASLTGGGRVSVDLEAAEEVGMGGQQTLELEFGFSGGRAFAALPVKLPTRAGGESVIKVVEVLVPDLVEGPRVIEVPAPTVTVGGVPPAGKNSSALAVEVESLSPGVDTVWLWYVLLPGVLLVALALFMLVGLRTRQLGREDLISTGPSKAARSLAYLECQDGSGQRHAVTRSAYRIGRHSDNDLTIRDASVSRQHAEIHRRRNGSFTITDLDSMNGVFVNQKKIDSETLADGDVIEIGDRSLRFRMREQAEPSGGETLAQQSMDTVTRLPNVAGR